MDSRHHDQGGRPGGVLQSWPCFDRHELAAGLGTQWRIASTGWTDAGNIDIEVNATFYLLMRNADDTTFWHVDSFEQTYPFKSYNKMQILGTELNGSGNPTSDDLAATLGILNAAISGLVTHSVSPASALDALAINRLTHVTGIRPSTVIVDATHGTDSLYMDSFGWTSDPSKEIVFSTTVLPESQAKTLQQPKYNLAVFCSCDAMAQDAPLGAYELAGALARATVGFAADVNIWAEDVATGMPVPVYKHAEVFFGALAEGKPVGEAKSLADQKYRVRFAGTGGAAGYQDMLCRGAESTRLKFVWVSNQEFFNLGGYYPNVNVIQLPIPPPGGGGPGSGGGN
jgi:hypothetical protein